jgi:pyruvate-ferredoxin/flavodoxin oxidoreductase
VTSPDLRSGRAVVDGNEAAARIAYLLSEVVAIYPITPASPMGEHADDWAAHGSPNLWGDVPEVIELQSEAGAAGTLHGAATKGSLATTFTASQGLLLMLPNMFKLAGELTPAVIHVAARTLATHALSIFGDHSDVMAARTTGWAMLCADGVQEAGDMALIAHLAALESRVPFLHFFDGFRTSHELNVADQLSAEQVRSMLDEDLVRAHRARGLDPDHPVLRGSAQNPDVFFQAREASNSFHAAVEPTVKRLLARFADMTGRTYDVVEYVGAPDAERVVVLMGSGVGAVDEAVEELRKADEKVGYVKVRLFRPFPTDALVAAIPPTAKRVAVLDRTKEPGAVGEPLFTDVVTSLAEAGRSDVKVIGGRYGLSSKEFTPAMAKAVFDELHAEQPKRRFTVGIVDDVTHLSLPVDPEFSTDRSRIRAVFYGLGADGTVGASKDTAKIIGEESGLHAQAYFVYDSKKSGSMTVSHLRADAEPIRSTYLISDATFVSVSQWGFLEKVDVLKLAAPGATVLVNSPYGPDVLWDHLTVEVQEAVLAKDLHLHTIDAHKVAREAGLPGRINTVMQPCFFALTDLLPLDVALDALGGAIRKTYGKRGDVIVERNLAAVRSSLTALHRVKVPGVRTSTHHMRPIVPASAPDFVQRVTAMMLAGDGDHLPVSALPVDGTFVTGTSRYERRTIAVEIPVWDPSLCIDCAKCTIVCPHAAIRMKVFDATAVNGDAAGLQVKPFRSREVPGLSLTIQVAPDDCTGCGVCVEACPARSKSEPKHKSLDMAPIGEHLEVDRQRWETFLALPSADVTAFEPDSIKGSQVREPLFEFSGACSGCGETPYLKLLTQLFGDHLIIANATGCSSIYGGNLPTTPYCTNEDGRGPAWANSLFEDNAEFGLGIQVAADRQRRSAIALVAALAPTIGHDFAAALAAGSDERGDIEIRKQRARVAELQRRITSLTTDPELGTTARRLMDLSSSLVRRSVWIVGGDGWAYDIGSGGLDHVLGSGRDVNVLVLDTEVYSNTGGQASKSTPRAAVAKFAAAGKATGKKDLAVAATTYGDVYVARIAIGANETQTVKALLEAEAHPGPSLVLAYSTCIAHGIDMSKSMVHMKQAVASGHWPLFRYDPDPADGEHPFRLDSHTPTMPYAEFAGGEARFAMLQRSAPEHARELLALAQKDVTERWAYYEQLAGLHRTAPGHAHAATIDGDE